MRFAFFIVLGLSLTFITGAVAQDKEVTLKGNITCAKCELNKEAKCMTVIVVKDGDKDIVYYFDPKAHKANHAGICKAGKKGSVVGTVAEKDGKKVVTVKKISFE
ncbi:MAG: DUF6370 family protein [Gemmataceae bacterium]